MGTCCSTTKGSSSSPTSNPVAAVSLSSKTRVNPNVSREKFSAVMYSANVENQSSQTKIKKEKQAPQQHQESGEGRVKETFMVKHRKSHDDRERNTKSPSGIVSFPKEASVSVDNENKMGAAPVSVSSSAAMSAVSVRTSSCTKEEVDAILIQCGRLSRNSSGEAATPSRRKYSGSKRSYDFDHCDDNNNVHAEDDQKKTVSTVNNSDLSEDDGYRRQLQQRHRQSPRSSAQGRRRTPSRERDQNQRSKSRERRVSRSPGRRSSETNNSANVTNAGSNNTGATSARPGKMISVPATVTSVVMDKSNNCGSAGTESATNTVVKRISVKRNVGGETGMVDSRTAASPRSKSPARANENGKLIHENQQQQPSPRRSSSRKAEPSPNRRNPLSEIDINSLAYPRAANNGCKVQKRTQKELGAEANLRQNTEMNDNKNRRTSSRGAMEKVVKEQLDEKAEEHANTDDNLISETLVASGVENQKQQTITRSRSSRRSRDLDFNHEAVMDDGNSYTAQLLEDIQNFHQKNTPSVAVPACVTKACSILQAVADLNSTTRLNLSYSFYDDRKTPPMQQFDRNDYNIPLGANKRVADSFVESEVVGRDDILEPSFYKYVTARRGAGDMEDQESSGSNSFVPSSQQQSGIPSSSWEPNSADSTDCGSSKLITKEHDPTRRKINGRRIESDHGHSNGVGRGRFGTSKGLQGIHYATTAAST